MQTTQPALTQDEDNRPTTKWADLFSKLKLSTRISVVTSVLFLIGILVVGAVSLNGFRSQLKDVLEDQQNTLLQRVADNLDQKLVMMQRGLVLSAKTVKPSDIATADDAQRFLDAQTGLQAMFERSVFLFSPEGRIIAEHPYRPARRGTDYSFRPYIRETVRTLKPYISEPFTTTKDDRDTVLMLTAPVIGEDGRLIAILTGSLGLTNPGMLGNISKAVVGKTGYLYLATSDGMLIMHPDKKRLAQPAFEPGKFKMFEQALKGYEGTAEAVEPDGAHVLTSFRKIPSADWIIAARYPVSEAFSPFNQMVLTFAQLLVVACILVLGAVWWLTRAQLRPLELLTRQIKGNSESGGRVALVDVEATAEIGDLKREFNGLVERLIDRETSLLETTRRYQLITEHSTDLITKVKADGVMTYASQASSALLGLHPEDLVGHAIGEFAHPKDRRLLKQTIDEALRDGEQKVLSYRVRRADHRYVWFESTLRLMPATEEAFQEILCISRDVSERKDMEDHLHDLARRDALTNLPNRLLLEEKIEKALYEATRENLFVALLMIDLDRFKTINDTLGHGAGDSLLKQAAARLQRCIRPSDIVSRWGGDEFVILLGGLRNIEVATEIADRCLKTLRAPFMYEGQELNLSGSIGISIYPHAGNEPEVLIKNADTAMYCAKDTANCYVIYEPRMNAEAKDRLVLENALHYALQRRELVLYYQPVISASSGRLVGAEALIRWQHPQFGLVPPCEFIPLAEHTGLIESIGEWVLREACEQMTRWRNAGLPSIRLAVNLSYRQFAKASIIDTVRSILDETGFDPHSLDLEITETVLMQDVANSNRLIDAFKQLGVSVSVDDFGTGYSSLNYLKQFSFNTLKIDRSFVKDIVGNERDAAILRSVVTLARNLNLKIVAEGVETREQMELLVHEGCNELQGYLFGKPAPADEFMNLSLSSPMTYIVGRKVAS